MIGINIVMRCLMVLYIVQRIYFFDGFYLVLIDLISNWKWNEKGFSESIIL